MIGEQQLREPEDQGADERDLKHDQDVLRARAEIHEDEGRERQRSRAARRRAASRPARGRPRSGAQRSPATDRAHSCGGRRSTTTFDTREPEVWSSADSGLGTSPSRSRPSRPRENPSRRPRTTSAARRTRTMESTAPRPRRMTTTPRTHPRGCANGKPCCSGFRTLGATSVMRHSPLAAAATSGAHCDKSTLNICSNRATSSAEIVPQLDAVVDRQLVLAAGTSDLVAEHDSTREVRGREVGIGADVLQCGSERMRGSIVTSWWNRTRSWSPKCSRYAARGWRRTTHPRRDRTTPSPAHHARVRRRAVANPWESACGGSDA